MKVVHSWLREFCPSDLDVDELADALTAVGVKVEEVLRPWSGLAGVIIARVLEVSDHPDSDKLCVVRVDTGSGERVVCAGVRNMAAGDLVPYAIPGSRVPALPEPLSVKRLRGVESAGMLCSSRELNIADVHTGILILDPTAPVGGDVKTFVGLDDAVLDIEIEPNRPDLMSVIGVAREAAAVTGAPFAIPPVDTAEVADAAADAVSVRIDDVGRCGEYLARVIRQVSVGESPLGVQARLTASGMRPVSDVVDATNYVLLERGHPLHPFDLGLIQDGVIIVRHADEGEHIETLDGTDRALSAEDLVIADAARPVAIAGVMGSELAEVSDGTRDVLLEAAWFSGTGILRTARRLGLATEASMRFERGVDPEGVKAAADRAASLIAAWTGGEILAGVAGAGGPPGRRSVAVRPERAAAVLGTPPMDPGEIQRRFALVGLPSTAAADAVTVTVPGWRPDIQREIDLIEEIVRVERGYEGVDGSLPAIRSAGGLPDAYAFRRRARTLLADLGFSEMRSLSFASAEDLELMGDPVERAIAVANPLAAEEGYLRTRLAPNLLRALQRNRARNVRSVRLFESGVIFRAGDPVEEVHKFGIAMTGPAASGWPADDRAMDISDATGVLDAFLEGLGVTAWSLEGAAPLPFHPGRSASVVIGGVHAGVVGEVHPRVCAAFDLTDRAAVIVLAAEVVRAGATREVATQDVPRFPPSRRDLAFVVTADTRAHDVERAIREGAGEGLGDLILFDVFTGDPIAEGSKSLAFSIELRDAERTLTDEETDAIIARISAVAAARVGAELRGA